MNEDLFSWFHFTLNASALVGIVPGILLTYLSPKKTAVIGGLAIVAGQMMTVFLVSTEHASMAKNSHAVLFAICVLSGQGSCLVLFSCLQALMNQMTI